jgi:hypothetical protein
MIFTQKPHLLFLDDIRVPYTVFDYTGNDIYTLSFWQIVRNYESFVAHIDQKGLPDVISFDHDLADSHYTPPEFWDDYEKSKEWQDAQVHTEKTGYDCAKWLVQYCIDNKKKLPKFYCHSLNPVGKDNILRLLNNHNN